MTKATKKLTHVGKSKLEKRAYRDRLNAPNPIGVNDTLYEKKNRIIKGEVSDTDEDQEENFDNKQRKNPYRSKKTKLESFWKKIKIPFIVALAILIISFVANRAWDMNREIGETKISLKDLEKSVTGLQQKYDDIEKTSNTFQVSISEINKDLEFIKEKINKLR